MREYIPIGSCHCNKLDFKTSLNWYAVDYLCSAFLIVKCFCCVKFVNESSDNYIACTLTTVHAIVEHHSISQ